MELEILHQILNELKELKQDVKLLKEDVKLLKEEQLKMKKDIEYLKIEVADHGVLLKSILEKLIKMEQVQQEHEHNFEKIRKIQLLG